MPNRIAKNLETNKIILPVSLKSIGLYSPYSISGNLLFISGQLPIVDGKIMNRKIPHKTEELEIISLKSAAKLCILNVISQASHALELNLDRVVSIPKVNIYLALDQNSNFEKHADIANVASQLLKDVFEDKGLHSRSTIGCYSLPLNASVEIDAIFEILS
jgi:enamine deaminase RidA (YjgF/YER057c/UK114 family)